MLKRRKGFDAVNPKRLRVLKALQDRELSATELRGVLGWDRGSVYYHLSILARAGLVAARVDRKRTFWVGSKKKFVEVNRFALTTEGIEALEYFKEVSW